MGENVIFKFQSTVSDCSDEVILFISNIELFYMASHSCRIIRIAKMKDDKIQCQNDGLLWGTILTVYQTLIIFNVHIKKL